MEPNKKKMKKFVGMPSRNGYRAMVGASSNAFVSAKKNVASIEKRLVDPLFGSFGRKCVILDDDEFGSVELSQNVSMDGLYSKSTEYHVDHTFDEIFCFINCYWKISLH